MKTNSSELFSDQSALTENEIEIINKCIPIKDFKKGTVLLAAGQIAREAYFIIKGCIRAYYLVGGEELTTAFYTENESCASLNSYTNQIPSTHYLECIEDCTLSVLTYQNEQQLIKK